jgi:hypothetical protein
LPATVTTVFAPVSLAPPIGSVPPAVNVSSYCVL